MVYELSNATGAMTAATAIGTKRYRAVKSGSDESLEEEGSEDEDDDEEILLTPRPSRRLLKRAGSSTSAYYGCRRRQKGEPMGRLVSCCFGPRRQTILLRDRASQGTQEGK